MATNRKIDSHIFLAMLYQKDEFKWISYIYDPEQRVLVTNWMYKYDCPVCAISESDNHGIARVIKSDGRVVFDVVENMIRVVTRKLWLYFTQDSPQYCYSVQMERIINTASEADPTLKDMLKPSDESPPEMQTLPGEVCGLLFDYWKEDGKEDDKEYDMWQIAKVDGVLLQVVSRSTDRMVVHYKCYDHHNDPRNTTTLERLDGKWTVTESVLHFEGTKYSSRPGFNF